MRKQTRPAHGRILDSEAGIVTTGLILPACLACPPEGKGPPAPLRCPADRISIMYVCTIPYVHSIVASERLADKLETASSTRAHTSGMLSAHACWYEQGGYRGKAGGFA
jgi:hypothetical protein